MKKFETLEIEYSADSGVAQVLLNNAPANAVTQAMYIEIAELFSEPEQIDPNIRVIVLSGKGKHFCAGNDLDEFQTMTPENGTERMWRIREAFFAIQDCPVPVIAAVKGVALGAGLCIAASSDIIVASHNASFGMPELTVGVSGGARQLARLVPQATVRRMFFTGLPVTGEELASFTGAVVACDQNELMSNALGFADRIAGYSPTAVRLSKRLLNRVEDMDVKSGYTYEQAFTVKMSGHVDSKEALAAFREKRKANYQPVNLDEFVY